MEDMRKKKKEEEVKSGRSEVEGRGERVEINSKWGLRWTRFYFLSSRRKCGGGFRSWEGGG